MTTEDFKTPENDPIEPATAAPQKDERPARLRGAGAAIALALLALAGAGGAGFLAWQQQQGMGALDARLAELDSSLKAQLADRASAASVQALSGELARGLAGQKQSIDTALAQQADALRAEIQAQQQALATLRGEVATQQQALDTLRALTGRDERLWRLGEIERLLTAAQTRLRLLDDAVTARLLLQEADRTAAPLGGEALPLREAFRQAMGGMNGSASLDREGLALRLTQLAEALPELPLAKFEPDEAPAAPAEGWWPKAKAWVGSWLHIASRNGAPTTARQDDALKGATAQLLDARRVLLARDTDKARALAQQVLDTASPRLDGKDARAASALEDLRGIVAQLAQPASAAVDLTPAFTTLRALRDAPAPTATGGE